MCLTGGWHGVNEDIPCEGENDDGYEGGDGQGDALEDPVDGHHDDAVGRPHRLYKEINKSTSEIIQCTKHLTPRTNKSLSMYF